MNALTLLLLLTAGDADIAGALPSVIDMLSADPGRDRFDCWTSRWKVNYFRAVHLCRPEGDPEAHRGYYEGQCEESETDRALGRLLSSIDRGPESIRRLWQAHKQAAFAALSPGMYRRSGAQETVASLREAYERAARSPAQRTQLTKVHRAVLDLTRDPAKRDAAYGWPWADLYYQAYPDFEPKSGVNAAWLLSFWARRLAEGNIDVVVEILDEIESYYRGKQGFEWGESFAPIYSPPVTHSSVAPRLFAVGWSCDGRFAYAQAHPGNGREAYADLVVVDLVRDQQLLRVEEGVAITEEDWVTERRDPLLSISPALRTKLRELGVDQPSPQKLSNLPWRMAGVEFDARLRTETTEEGERRSVVFRRGARDKTIHTWSVAKGILEMHEDRGARVLGIIASPCEERVAVVIAQGYAGYHGPPSGESLWVVGAHLSTGFGDAKK